MLERFWEHIDKNGPPHPYRPELENCWLDTQADVKDGYRHLWDGDKKLFVNSHRYSWKIHYGEIPDGLLVCHNCDVRACVRPTHLFLGTNADNSKDMVQKKRSCPGEQNTQHKLIAENIPEIFSLYDRGVRQRDIAVIFGVSQRLILNVLKGRAWKHVSVTLIGETRASENRVVDG